MDYIKRLPFFLGVAMAILVGIICNSYGISQQETYMKMAIVIVIFFILGIYVRSFLTGIIDDINKKKEEELKKEEIDLEQAEIGQNADGKATVSQIDYKVDDSSDDFSPLPVSEYIKNKING